ncbi:MAG: hypothetical protein QNK20_16555 [Aureibaculum sp.]|nr:hypothetical protein [Aureibaculum sp.]
MSDIVPHIDEVGLKDSADTRINPGTEDKQDIQITNQGTETVAPPLGTKMLGWLQSIWTALTGVLITKPIQNLDATGRLRVSELTTLIDLKQTVDNIPLFYDQELNGAATAVHSTLNAEVVMSVTNNGDYAIRQTKMRFNYQTGKSYLILETFDSMEVQTDVTKRVGYFNSNDVAPFDSDKDGFWFESSDQIYTVVEKAGTVTSKTAQSDWNVDKLDGTGPSGITADWSLGQILIMDMLWLGKAGIRWYIEIDNMPILFHVDNYANTIKEVYISNPNHSVRYEIRSTGGAGSMSQVCSTVAIEGSRNKTGIIKGHNVGTTKLDANTKDTTYAAMGIRLKSAYLTAEVDLLVFSLLGTTADSFLWELRSNPTVAGTFTYVDEPNSALQIARGATANTITGGDIIDNGYVYQKASERAVIENALRLGTKINGTRDEFVLMVTPLSNGLDVYTSFTGREIL